VLEAHGGRSLHEQSHGESFLALVQNRFFANGLYILTSRRPRSLRNGSCLSSSRSTSCHGEELPVHHRHALTHHPGLPGRDHLRARLDGVTKVAYEDTEHYALTRDFLQNRERYLRRLLGNGEG